MTLEQFQTLADAYGANVDRWPTKHRSVAAQFLASEPRAIAVMAEAQALDGLLNLQLPVREGRAADLAERIVAAASTVPFGQAGLAPQSSPSVVVPLPRRQPRPGLTKELNEAPVAPRHSIATVLPARRIARFWPAAAALAASLAFGITIGVHDLTHTPVRTLVAMAHAGNDTDVDQFVDALHTDGIALGTDEDRQ